MAHTDDGEYFLDAPPLRQFITTIETQRRQLADPAALLDAIRPAFVALLADQEWLPDEYRRQAVSGMGSGIGTWLLYRAADGGLAFTSLVVPPGAATPVHDHLAWGLVGLYLGEQEEEVFARRDDGATPGRAEMELTLRRSLQPGDLYPLLPECDIHRVRTTSAVTSVSLHLLGNDNGCIWRHRFDPDAGRVEPFRSGYVNAGCRNEGDGAPRA